MGDKNVIAHFPMREKRRRCISSLEGRLNQHSISSELGVSRKTVIMYLISRV